MNEFDPNASPSAYSEHGKPAQTLNSAGRPPEPSFIHRVFHGPKEIRAGWRLAIFVLLCSAFGFLIIGAFSFLTQGSLGKSDEAKLWGEMAAEPMLFVAVVLATVIMGGVEKRTFADYGLPGRGAFGAHFWRGVMWGFVALTALLLLIKLGHGFEFGSVALSGGRIAMWASLWGVSFLFVGFFEEFMFRGYSLFTLSTGMRFWPSAVLLSVIFGAIHLNNVGEDWAGGLAAGLIGLFFCFTLRRTGSLWFAIGLHAAWDYSESFIYGVPDSGLVSPGHLLNARFHGPTWLTGGSVGPEGSAFVFVVIAALFLIFAWQYRGVRFPRQAASVQPSAASEPA